MYSYMFITGIYTARLLVYLRKLHLTWVRQVNLYIQINNRWVAGGEIIHL